MTATPVAAGWSLDQVLSGRTWWAARRLARPLDRFRIAAGAALFAHFAGHFVGTEPLLAWTGLLDAGIRTSGPSPSWLGSGLLPSELRGVFAFGMLLSLAISAGVLPRLAAVALYGISFVTYRAIWPIADLGDYLVSVTALFLALMPVGNSLAVGSSGHESAGEAMVPGLAVSLYLCFVAVIYLAAGFGELPGSSGGRWVEVATRMLPIAFIVPAPALRVLGIFAQLSIHGYLIATNGWAPTHALLAASCLLFWGDPEGEAQASRPWLVDAGSVCAAAIAVVLVFAEGARLLGLGSAFAPSLRVLADAGLLPMPPSPRRDRRGQLLVAPKDPTLGPGVPIVGGARRLEALAGVLGDIDGNASVRLGLATAIARRQCITKGYWGWEGVLVLRGEAEERHIVEFECGPGGSLAQLR